MSRQIIGIHKIKTIADFLLALLTTIAFLKKDFDKNTLRVAASLAVHPYTFAKFIFPFQDKRPRVVPGFI